MNFRRSIVSLAAALTLSALVLPGMVLAQGQGPGQGRQGGGPGGRGGRGQNPVMTALQAVNLTDDQKTKVQEIFSKYRDEMRSAGQSQTPEQRRERSTKLNADIEALLTPEQKTRFQAEVVKARQAQGAMPIMMALEPLNLTDEQKAKASPIVREVGAQLMKLREDDSLDRQARTTKTQAIFADLKTKLRPILTAEQQTKLDSLQMRGRGGRGGAGGGGRRGGGQQGAGQVGA